MPLHPDWPKSLRALLLVHILAGAVAFVCAPVALVTAKGGRAHRQWGRVYFWAMAVVAATALLLSAFAAYRVLYQKTCTKACLRSRWIARQRC